MGWGRLLIAFVALALIAVPTRACAFDGTMPVDEARAVLLAYTASAERRAMGDLAGAVAAIEEARRQAPLDPDLAIESARLYAAARQYGAAAIAYTDATTLAPGVVEPLLEKARFHLAGGFRIDQAVAAARDAVRLDSTHLGARLVLAAAEVATLAAGPREYLDASSGGSYNSDTHQANGNGGTIYGGRGGCCYGYQFSE